MSEANELNQSSPRAAFAGRWQIPLLSLGLILLGTGLIRIAVAHQPVGFDEKLRRVGVLHQTGAWQRANAYLLDLLEDADRPPEQRAELHRLVAATAYQAELPLTVHSRQNIHAITTNFQAALRYGATPTAADWIVLGDAYRWAGDDAEAADAYRQALGLSPARPDRLHRMLVELHLDAGRPVAAQTLLELDAILDDAAASPANYLWAAEHKVDYLLDQGQAPAALALAKDAEQRLAGTAERPAVTYIEALSLCHNATRYVPAAAARLRSLLTDWTVRDELWGKANWLLGKLQHLDDRPQAALWFFDEVIGVFQSGPLHDACKLGRAEGLAALQRYQRSLETFAGLEDRLSAPGRHRMLDRDAVRATVTAIGESLLQDGSRELGIEFMRFALSLVAPTDREARAFYVARMAAALTQIARSTGTEPATRTPDPQRTADLLAESADMYLALADLQTLDEQRAAEALTLAAENLDAAGMTEHLIEVLTRFVDEHVVNEGRPAALYRLGRAYQALQQYDNAVATFQEVIERYPRLLSAHASMVPLAECLIGLGGEAAVRGADILISIVDDVGSDHLFDPRANEYRDALFRLAEYYVQCTEQEVLHHWEKAIARLEDAIALYPADPNLTRLSFLLADAYRLSATELRALETTSPDERTRAAVREEADRRFQRSLQTFEQVIATLASQDLSALSNLELTYLRAGYLYRADGLFDLGRYEAAIEAYNEAIWRYENLPTAVSASMQVLHCYQRLGQSDEARAALKRLSWLLRKIPPDAFETERGMSSKQYWEKMVSRMESTGVF